MARVYMKTASHKPARYNSRVGSRIWSYADRPKAVKVEKPGSKAVAHKQSTLQAKPFTKPGKVSNAKAPGKVNVKRKTSWTKR